MGEGLELERASHAQLLVLSRLLPGIQISAVCAVYSSVARRPYDQACRRGACRRGASRCDPTGTGSWMHICSGDAGDGQGFRPRRRVATQCAEQLPNSYSPILQSRLQCCVECCAAVAPAAEQWRNSYVSQCAESLTGVDGLCAS